jgi:hypothetical protein
MKSVKTSQRRKITAGKMRDTALLFSAFAILTGPAASQGESSSEESQRWVPAFAIQSHLISQQAEGSLQSSQRPPDTPGSVTSDDGWLVDPSIGLSFELSTPQFAEVFGRPRAFAHAGASYTIGSAVTLAQEGAPGEFVEPPVDPLQDFRPDLVQLLEAKTVTGQGTRNRAETQPLVISAGAGIAFSFDLRGRRVRLKPSLEYIREDIEGSGEMRNAAGTRSSVGGVVVVPFEYTVLSSSQKKTLHGLGGGLEIEMDATRAGDFLLSIFASGQVYSRLGDRSLAFTRSDGTHTASWSVEMDRVLYRGGVGLRFRYLPE